MPREVVALVSADDVVAAVRVHADRVHDMLRRSGCGPEESVEVCESYAFGLIDAIASAPETVGDMAGWWFGRALELGRRLGDTGSEPVDEAEEASASVLSGTEGESQVRAALATLPEHERAAVVLRDAYDLPPQAVAVALKRTTEGTDALVAAGRLDLVSRYDDRRVPDLLGHTGRTPADLGTLGRLADGSLPPQQMVPLRRHLNSCSACEEVVELLARARRLAAALPVVAMPDDAREAMLERIEVRAAAVLPTVDEVMLAVEQDGDDRPAISPLVIVLAIALALVLGVAAAAVTNLSTSNEPLSLSSPQAQPTEEPSFSVTPRPKLRHRRSVSPSASASASRSASPTPTSASPSATTTEAPAPTLVADIDISPTSGPSGTTITVKGQGWDPGSVVEISYSGSLVGASRSSVTVNDNGRFTGQIEARGTLPGRYSVDADNGSQTASAQFRQTS